MSLPVYCISKSYGKYIRKYIITTFSPLHLATHTVYIFSVGIVPCTLCGHYIVLMVWGIAEHKEHQVREEQA